MAQDCILLLFSSLNWSRAAVNFSVTTSHRSIRSLKPFSRASRAVVESGIRVSQGDPWICLLSRIHDLCSLTTSLDTEVHLRVGGVGNSVSAEIHGRAISVSDTISEANPSERVTHFFMMANRSALPMVWPSPSNWNDAAVSEEPGSYAMC